MSWYYVLFIGWLAGLILIALPCRAMNAFDRFDRGAFLTGAVLWTLFIGFTAGMAYENVEDDKQFAIDCAAQHFSQSQCDFLQRQHDAARDAQTTATIALGAAAGASASAAASVGRR